MPSDPEDFTAEETRLLARRPGLSPEDRRFVVNALRDPSPRVRYLTRRMIYMSQAELGDLMRLIDDPHALRAIAGAPFN